MSVVAGSSTTRGDDHDPIDPALLDHPLDFIAADHLRERQICADLDRLASAEIPDRDAMQKALRFFNEEFSTHIRDEAEDLFPLMRRRCLPEDEIAQAIARIRTDHDAVRTLLPAVRQDLAACLDEDRRPTEAECETLVLFTRHMRRHLIAENAILLPLARARLTVQDLESLRLRMQARRGISDAVSPST